MSYVAYIHAKPDTVDAFGIFYVGKGLPRRAKKVVRNDSSNRHYKHTVAKYGADNILIGMLPCSSEQIAFDLERGLIRCLRRMGVELTNLTQGGEGSTGYIPTVETLNKISANSANMWKNPDYREKVIAAQTEAQRKLEVTEQKRQVARENAAKGRQVLASEKKAEAAKKNSEKSLKVWSDPEFKARMKRVHTNRWTPELRAAKGDVTRGRIRVTNGVEERNVLPEVVDTLLAEGWVRGRKPRKSSKRTKSN